MIGEIFKFLLRLLGNQFASHKIEPQCFSCTSQSAFLSRFLSPALGVRKLLILLQAAFFKNLFSPAGKPWGKTMQLIIKFM